MNTQIYDKYDRPLYCFKSRWYRGTDFSFKTKFLHWDYFLNWNCQQAASQKTWPQTEVVSDTFLAEKTENLTRVSGVKKHQ